MKFLNLKFLAAVILSAILLSLAWSANFPGWILGFAFVPLFWLEDRTLKLDSVKCFLPFYSWVFIALLGWNILSTWWIGYVSLGGMLLIAFLNALVMTLVWELFHWSKKYFKRSIANLFFVAAWLCLEYLETKWQLAWPWLNLGNGLGNVVKWVQWYQYAGPLGGTLWLLIVNMVAYRILRTALDRKVIPAVGSGLLFLFVVLVPYWWSSSLFHQSIAGDKTEEVILLQPNNDPYTAKFNTSDALRIHQLLNLTDSLISPSTGLVVTPETALPVLHEGNQLSREESLVPFHNLIKKYTSLSFIAGAMTRIDYASNSHPENARSDDGANFYDYANSSLLIDSTSSVQIYHKTELVNGVEKIPFPSIFSFFKKHLIDLGGISGSLVANTHPQLFFTPDSIAIAPVICFESAFSNHVAALTHRGANLIVVQTNDGWWKDSSGARQHLNFARLRAIENRKYVVQSANTGISGIIDDKGIIHAQTALDKQTAIKGNVQLNSVVTFYSLYGDYIGRVSLMVLVLLGLYFIAQRRIQKDLKNPH